MKVFALASPAALLLLIFANFSFIQAQDSIYRLPAGTRMMLKLDAEINSKVSSVNDTFVAILTRPVVIRGTTVLAKGTVVEGRIAGVERAEIGGKSGRLDVTFEWLRLARDQRRKIDGKLLSPIPVKSSSRLTTLSILGGALIGGAIGATGRSPAKAAAGVVIGGGTGAVIGLARRGKEARMGTDEEFEIELKAEVVLPVLDY